MKKQYSELELIKRAKLKVYKDMNISPYSKDVQYTHTSEILKQQFQLFSKEELQQKQENVSIVGRIMAHRGPFIIIKDSKGSTQIYISKKDLLDLTFKIINTLDIGDIVKFVGVVMKTKTNQLSIKANQVVILAKSLKPFPEKFHGLKNIEERFRKRYLDIIFNEEVKNRFWTRAKIISTIRKFFDDLNFLEAETPILQPILGGANALPFKTYHNTLHMPFYLRIATELPLKKMLVGGIDKVYEIGRLFRNEGVDTTHNPEFTTIEFYEAYSNLEGMMQRTEEVFAFIAKTLNISKLKFSGHTIDITKPFKRLNMVDVINERLNVDFRNISFSKAVMLAKKHNIKIEKYFKLGHIINAFFEELIEDTLIEPTFVYGYPIEISSLAVKDSNDPRFTERAELFIIGKEYANMFTELNDPIDQLERFKAQLLERKLGNNEANEIDMDFVEALEYGMPPAGGCGIGIDRLIMLFTGAKSIREVVFFPHLKFKGKNE